MTLLYWRHTQQLPPISLISGEKTFALTWKKCRILPFVNFDYDNEPFYDNLRCINERRDVFCPSHRSNHEKVMKIHKNTENLTSGWIWVQHHLPSYATLTIPIHSVVKCLPNICATFGRFFWKRVCFNVQQMALHTQIHPKIGLHICCDLPKTFWSVLCVPCSESVKHLIHPISYVVHHLCNGLTWDCIRL